MYYTLFDKIKPQIQEKTCIAMQQIKKSLPLFR